MHEEAQEKEKQENRRDSIPQEAKAGCPRGLLRGGIGAAAVDEEPFQEALV